MNRTDFQELAEVRLREAQELLAHGLYDGAYYLAGYSIECALKACIARKTNQYDFPPSPERVRNYYIHDLNRLLNQAGLTSTFETAKQGNPALVDSWKTIEEWSEESRYARARQRDAEAIINAIADPKNGVLQWLKTQW